MKKIILAVSLMYVGCTFAQVGISTATPQSTLDVVGDADNTTKLDGIIAPRITGNQLSAKSYTTAQTGAMVYVTASASTLTGQVINVAAPGYYYFDGTVWQVFKGSASTTDAWKITGNAGTVDNTHFLGTTDDVSLNFRVNNIPAGRIDAQLLNSFYGFRAGLNTVFSGIGNTGIGNNALRANTTGASNTSMGDSSMAFNVTGFQNTAVGVVSLNNNTSGNFNAAFGATALGINSTGSWNTSLGSQSLPSNTTGEYNIGVGPGSLANNTTGSQNIGLGNFVLNDKVSGDHNIALGYLAGKTLTTGNNNIFIGQNTIPTISTTGSNQLNIGNWIYGNNGRIGLGTATVPNSILHIGGSFAAPIKTGSGLLAITDYTVLGSGDITLPDPTTVTGRIYNIIYDGVDFTVSGLLRNNGTNFSTYGMNAGNPTKKITVQSNGSRWVIY